MSFSDVRFSDINFHYKSVVSKKLAEEKILEITIDNKLNFEYHITKHLHSYKSKVKCPFQNFK